MYSIWRMRDTEALLQSKRRTPGLATVRNGLVPFTSRICFTIAINEESILNVECPQHRQADVPSRDGENGLRY
jgi:hypothetical protein